ncbi:MAG TPA: glycosyltransferase family 87 protein [Candidatus Acidoferrales bacterium]|nr:glycosyltransferase family 87 protein [Candidatus Acidoferrales bacterium]
MTALLAGAEYSGRTVLSRSSLIGVLVTLIAALFIGQYVRVWMAIPDAQARTSDFAGTYAAATLWSRGDAAHMYDSQAEQQVLAAAGTPADHLNIPFENPPAAAVLASPLVSLDPTTAYRVWSLIQLGLLAAAIAIAAWAAPWSSRSRPIVRVAAVAVAAAGLGSGLLFIEGQWDGVAALGVALAYVAWRRDSGVWAGWAIGFSLALAKPHLALGFAAFALGRRDWRAAGTMVAGAVSAGLAGLATAGVAGTSGFVHALLLPSNNPLFVMQGASGLVTSWLGGSLPVLLITVAASLAGAGAAAWMGWVSRNRPGSLEPALAGAIVLTLFISPHLLGHDLTLLAPAVVFGMAWIAAREAAGGQRWPGRLSITVLLTWTLISLATQQDLGNYSSAPPGRLTPWMLLIAAGLCGAALAASVRAPGDAATGAERLTVSAAG